MLDSLVDGFQFAALRLGYHLVLANTHYTNYNEKDHHCYRSSLRCCFCFSTLSSIGRISSMQAVLMETM